MIIPKKVKIGALIFSVEIVDSIGEHHEAMGETDFQKLSIKIAKGERKNMENTFLHELLHTFNSAFNDESNIQYLANELQNFIEDNPGVFK